MKRILFVLVFLFNLASSVGAQTENQNVDNLITQLGGGSCTCETSGMFDIMGESKSFPSCKKRKMFASFARRNDNYQCIVDASLCLASLKEKARPAIPALINALKKYQDIDTGDGIIPVRQSIAAALGFIGDTRAIPPLIEILQTDEPVKLSSGASVITLQTGTYQGMVMSSLGMFGPKAKEAAPYIAPFLKTSGQGYYQKYTACHAAYALGEIGDSQSIPALIDALKHPECYYAAAEALSKFGVKSKEALPALYELQKSLLGKPSNYEDNKVSEAIKIIEKAIK